ncbi:hypothetical protein PIB30_060891 [Stylosanthes scabra]|uniref:Uncharacterized protein n=1 Tax=Stylosanthes scabra TaxID=79078 RepID=A0ABU6ULJ2_9FABA|nr:hypothetical protein [Stylosanthes scabra]
MIQNEEPIMYPLKVIGNSQIHTQQIRGIAKLQLPGIRPLEIESNVTLMGCTAMAQTWEQQLWYSVTVAANWLKLIPPKVQLILHCK